MTEPIGRITSIEEDELNRGVAFIAELFKDEVKAMTPGDRRSLIRDDVELRLRSQFSTLYFGHSYEESHRAWLARPWYQKAWFRFRTKVIGWRWNLYYAGRHLRGIACEWDD